MELYSRVSYTLAEQLTNAYSTSFSMSSRLFDPAIRPHIYAIYGLVRIADEIVDTYMGSDAPTLLNDLEAEVIRCIQSPHAFSANPIIQAFAETATAFSIDSSLVQPFFKSMRVDLTATSFTDASYKDYIYGSAEVIGLMCLKIFTDDDSTLYETLKPGATALGSAYQKVNFLRDIKDDFETRGRVYFPGVHFETFNDTQKRAIEADIDKEFAIAKDYIDQIPMTARKAIRTSYAYYTELLRTLERTDAAAIKTRRFSVPTAKKLALFAKVKVGRA